MQAGSLFWQQSAEARAVQPDWLQVEDSCIVRKMPHEEAMASRTLQWTWWLACICSAGEFLVLTLMHGCHCVRIQTYDMREM